MKVNDENNQELPNSVDPGPLSKRRIIALFLAGAAFVVLQATWLRLQLPTLGYRGTHSLPDLVLLLIVLTPFAAATRWLPRAAGIAALLLSIVWAISYAAQLQFLIKTGTYASRPLILYSLAHVGDVSSVALSGADGAFALKLAAGLCLVVGAFYLRPLHRVISKMPGRGAVAALMVAVLLGAVLNPANRGGLVGPLLSDGFVMDLPPVLDPQPRYDAPFLTTSARLIKPPDIVILIVESGRADLIDLALPQPRPVFINRLAREAVTFQRAYTTTSHTSKALIGILCGHYPNPQMEILEAVPGNLPLTCLPRLLRETGYETHFLQTALGSFEGRRNLVANLGFDHIVVQEDLSQEFSKAGYFSMDERALLEPLERAARDRKPRQPVFITMLTSLSHHPYAMPGEAVPGEQPPYAYGTAIEYVDAFLAEAYERIGRHLNWDETILVVLGDHGEAFAEHGLQQHDSVPYEEVVRIPLLVRYPRRLASKADQALRQTIDIFPTVLELIGLEWSGEIAGKSLLEGEGHSQVTTSCWPTRTCHAVIFENRMKVVYNFGNAAEEVFNLQSDPRELIDLSDQPAADALVFRAAQEIARVRRTGELPYQAAAPGSTE